MAELTKSCFFKAIDLTAKHNNETEHDGFRLSVFHSEGDPGSSNRVKVSNRLVEVEMLPSKGFSLSQAWIDGKPLFWEAPVDLPDTETIDLWSDEIYINGKPAPGFTYLKTFIGGVELLGLKNWGMPISDKGRFHPLHGETSNIPVKEVQFLVEDDVCTVQASFIYRTFEGDNMLPWYERGKEIFRVTKKLILIKGSLEIKIEDTIENISNTNQLPDWGYHVTFRPEPGAKYLISASSAECRGGGILPEDYNIWQPSPDPKHRIEKGIIFKGIQKKGTGDFFHSLLLYPDGSGISVRTTPSPYFQTWFCSGGAGSNEFTRRNGEPVLKKNWDGIGIEFGSSDLDHDGNTDPSVNSEPELKPGEIRQIVLGFEFACKSVAPF